VGIVDELNGRGLIHTASEGALEALQTRSITAYIGFDPTADSLHVGSLLPIMALARLQKAGHRPIAIAGGGTGLIGDPSGKAAERQLLTSDQIEMNLTGIRAQLERFLDFSATSQQAIVVNNADWLTKTDLMSFLRDVGKHFSVNYMISKESVRRRIDQEDSISFTEFTYMLLQAYDFLVLHERYGCEFQMGGSDQWGNITAGIDLIRKTKRARAYGLVFPLVTTSTGLKFGKTEAGTVWLSAERTSPFHFYQFWINIDDRDVSAYLKYFTWLSLTEISQLEEDHVRAPEKRQAQRALARAVTTIVHGEALCQKAEKISEVLFGGQLERLTPSELADIIDDLPSSAMERSEFVGKLTIADACVHSGLCASKGEARRLAAGGGLYLNGDRVENTERTTEATDLVLNSLLVLRKGARDYRLIRLGRG